jgi:hypothetical protein
MINVDFNQNNWEQVWSTAVSATSEQHLTCPQLLTSSVIALMLVVPIFTTEYRFAAYVQRDVFSGLIVGGIPDARLDSSRKLFANKLQIYSYNVACTYALNVRCFVHGSGVTLNVWQHTGIVT